MKDHITKGLAMVLTGAGLAALTPSSAPAQPAERAITRDLAGPGLQWGPCPSFMPSGCQIAVLHGDPAKHNADVFFRLPGNSKAERHWHNSAERMVLIAGELLVEFDGQDAVVMRPGTYAFGPARLPHSAACRSAEACVLFIAFEEPVDAMEGAPR
ncbi:cupin domain-containing protein [Belnapia rosea]|jgi:mannose-6-phosphate isomerase-like protein (cupin superfamily)|uniref:Cupin domain-containing protein n=1 Tax=Belnapia rosea TaxID=938405 RepID=A0A1G6JC65_9PROT|nr:cupin domain-containing protein [Belnapia rosea]SDB10893.1 Cupin domain-containing protein [Belnapia rosea]SDC15985.1 Cupin domain-containing protein [Belnapia rosea]